MSNRIIIPANYTVEIVALYDPKTGQTELRVRNRSGQQLSMLQIAALLIEHASISLKGIITNTTKVEEIKDTTLEGGANAS